MSSFYCNKCGTAIIDSPYSRGYLTECEHYPFERYGCKTKTVEEHKTENINDKEKDDVRKQN